MAIWLKYERKEKIQIKRKTLIFTFTNIESSYFISGTKFS